MFDTPAPSPHVRTLLAHASAAITALGRAADRVLRIVDALDTAGAADETGHRSTGRLLQEHLRIDRREARELVEHSALVVGQPGLSGTPIPPALPATAHALGDGAIRRPHLTVIAETMRQVARVPHLSPSVVAETERQLAALARERSPRQLARDAAEILLLLDPDGELTPDADRPVQELHLSTGRDGTLSGRFRFADPESAETLRVALDTHTPPPDPEHDTSPAHPARTLEERQATALHDIAADAIGLPGPETPTDPIDDSVPIDDEPPVDEAAERPDLRTRGGGPPVHLTVTVPLEVLENRIAGYGLLDGQWAISAETIRRLACDATVIPTVLGTRGEPLDLGRATRVVSSALRRAVITRDRHCAHPGCRRRARRCHVHHVIPWSQGGRTDLDNLVLLCPYHHHLVHHSGWSIAIRGGIPIFTPPAWLDPLQRPRSRPRDLAPA